MAVANYSYSVPVLLSGLQTLSFVLTKAANYAKESNTPPSDIINGTIKPDKKPLSHQIKGAVRIAKNTLVYLTDGVDIPDQEGSFDTFEELQSLLTNTITLLQGSADKFDKADTDEINFSFEGKPQLISAQYYVTKYVLPDFFFHLSNSYTILKIQGVPLSKTDFLANFVL